VHQYISVVCTDVVKPKARQNSFCDLFVFLIFSNDRTKKIDPLAVVQAMKQPLSIALIGWYYERKYFFDCVFQEIVQERDLPQRVDVTDTRESMSLRGPAVDVLIFCHGAATAISHSFRFEDFPR